LSQSAQVRHNSRALRSPMSLVPLIFESEPPQPPLMAVLTLLPARDVIRLAGCSQSLARVASTLCLDLLLLRHPSLGGAQWPRRQWPQAAARLEEAICVENFDEEWSLRWQHRGENRYCMPARVYGIGASLRALAVGPPLGMTLHPGSGVLWHLPAPMCPNSVSWLAFTQGISKSADGRIGCLSLQEAPGCEIIRVYFNHGALLCEISGRCPVELIPRGSVKDSNWYHIHFQLNWGMCDSDVLIQSLDGKSTVPECWNHHSLPWHSHACTKLTRLSAGSVVFGSSRLSGSRVYLAEICIT